MKNYVVLDIENPNSKGNSICSIGLIVVQNNIITKKLDILVNPEDVFDHLNIKITGIDSSKVSSKRTLDKVWFDIKDLLINNIVVCHNASYDLSVLGKSLGRYKIQLPPLTYCCSLMLSKTYIKANSYKLSALAEILNIKYTPHKAIEDALVTYHLIEYIKLKHKINENHFNTFNFEYRLVENLDDKLIKKINELYGLILGIDYDKVINIKEINNLSKWVNDNKKFNYYAIFDKLIEEINCIIEDKIIDKNEKERLLNLITPITESKIYKEETLSIQILLGILRGVTADGIINEEEINQLKLWLDYNKHLKGQYQFDKVFSVIENALEDQVISDNEKNEILDTFVSIVNFTTDKENVISIEDKLICLTGEFKSGTREQVTQKLSLQGAIMKSGVVVKLDYLIVGSYGSATWKLDNYGEKVIRAKELQEKGSNVKIISENDIIDFLNKKL